MAKNPIKAKVPTGPNQIPKDAELIEVTESKEPWAEYQLADGSMIKLKQVVAEIWRVENEFDGEGNPIYVVKSSPAINVTANPSLKKSVN